MKAKTLAALAGLGGATMISSTSSAAYIGLTLVNATSYFDSHPNTSVRANWLANGAGQYTVWRVFAAFDGLGGANDRVNVINGQFGHPADMFVSGGTFYNYTTVYSGVTTHYDIAPTNFAGGINGFNAFRSWETWMTINRAGGDGVNNAQFAPGSTDPGQWNHFMGNYSANNAAMYITPDDPQGAAINWSAQGGPLFGVLLMQITVPVGTFFTGHWNLSLGAPGGIYEALDQYLTPAPGGLALMLMAWPAMGSRRRRA